MNSSLRTFAVLALTVSAAARAQESGLDRQVDAAAAAQQAASQPLQGIVVTGSSNPLLRADQRLALLGASLPLDARNGIEQPAGWQRVALLFPQDPDAAEGEARRMMARNLAPPASQDPDGSVLVDVR
jgi:hypothetical protein